MVEQNAPKSRLITLADSWIAESTAIAHLLHCSDYRCPTCAVIACAADLRLLAKDVGE